MRLTETLIAAALAALLGLLVPTGAAAQIDPDDLLPVGEAFDLDASVGSDQSAIDLTWAIADGYYMYRHAFLFEPVGESLQLGTPEIESGQAYTDEFFGEVEIYRGSARVRVPVTALPESGDLMIEVGYQGCADLGVCYPPQREQVRLDAAELRVDGRPAAPRSEPVPGGSGNALDDLLSGFGDSNSGLTGRGAPLPPEQAFRVETIALGADELLARFTVHPDYYLYRDTIGFSVDDAGFRAGELKLPPAEPITDEYFGDTFVYFGEVEIPFDLARPAGDSRRITLQVDFQGCQVDGICYPPMQRSIDVDLPAATEAAVLPNTPGAGTPTTASSAPVGSTPAGAITPEAGSVSAQSRLAGALADSPLLALGLFFIAGVLLAFTPCVFPMVPILSGLIAGDAGHMSTLRAFRLSVVYVLAMAVVYTAFGVIAALLGQNLQALFQHPVVLGAFALLFVLLSLAMFGFYELQLPSSWQTRLNAMSNRQQGGTLIGAAIMGGLSALVVGPCVAPALMGALVYIGQTGDAWLGGSALFAMALGMGLPLVVWGTSAGRLLPRAGVWMRAVKAVFGVGLLALAVWMLERVLPGGVIMLLWGGLAVACGVYLGALNRTEAGTAGWPRLWQALGIVLLVFGVVQLIGALAGGRDWTRPLAPLTAGPTAANEVAVEFTEVDDLAQLERALAAATRPVFVDFYADWCVDCIRMDRRTFPDPAVAEMLAGFDLIKIDLTDFNDAHREVLAEFGLIGPPAYLFFSNERELEALRMYGFMAPEEFRAHLDRVAQATDA